MRIKISCWMICLALLLGLTGCAGQRSPSDGKDTTSSEDSSIKDLISENGDGKQTVAISMPSQAQEKWISAAAIMDTYLTDAGYQVTVGFAEDDAKQQIEGLERSIKQKAACLIVAPIPSADLTETLDKAKKAKIPVISYESLVMGTDAVDYYTGFDNLEAGRQIGRYIAQEKGLRRSVSTDKTRSYTIEFFAGDPQDYSAKMVHEGILEILQPYLDSGQLVCKSGRVRFEDTAILYGSQETAQRNCEALLDANHLDGHLDIACTSSDTLAYGVQTALKNKGYTQSDWPLVTGQDAQIDAVKDIKAGYQAMSVFRDTRTLAEKCAQTAVDCLKGKKPATNDKEHYKNGTKAVPSYLCDTQVVDKENYEELLIDSGYYTKDQLS